MVEKVRHAFGNSANVESALESGAIDAYDILLLDGDTDNPKIGWVDKNGKAVILKDEKVDLTEVEADVEALEAEMVKKANAIEVEEKLDKVATESVATAKAYTDGKVEAAIAEHLAKKYEVANVPIGTLVDYEENEIRIMCPENSVFTKQAVGEGGDSDSYYMTFKTYVYDDNVVGYVEHLGDKSDEEILTDLKTDEYGRKYQPTWLPLAKYDEASDSWTYHGKNSSEEKFIGWDYQIDWYDANGVMIGSDSVRINLSNEECHFGNKPYYVGSMMKDIDTKIEERIAEMESAWEIVEF